MAENELELRLVCLCINTREILKSCPRVQEREQLFLTCPKCSFLVAVAQGRLKLMMGAFPTILHGRLRHTFLALLCGISRSSSSSFESVATKASSSLEGAP